MALVLKKSRLISKIFFGVFWIVALIPFIGQQFALSAYESIIPYISVLADFVIIALGLWLIKDKTDWILLISFVLLAYISTCVINKLSLLHFINGMRLYIGYLFLVPILKYFFNNDNLRKYFILKMDRTLYLFLWIQVPCMIYQCILYGAYDKVGGSLGWMMSGVISTMIYLISLYLMLKRWNNKKTYFQNLCDNWILVFLLFPSFLNETKISFVFLAMYFFFLIPMDKNYIKKLIIVAPIILVILCGSVYFYYATTGNKENILSEEYISFYLHGDEDSLNLVELAFDGDELDTAEDQGNDWARGLKLAVIPWMFQTKKYTEFFGFGIGQFKGGTIVERTSFYKEYEWILKGSVLQIQIWLIELGVLGLLWSVVFWIVAFGLFRKCKRHYQFQLYMLSVVIITSVYNCCFIIMPFYVVFMYMALMSCDRRNISDSNT